MDCWDGIEIAVAVAVAVAVVGFLRTSLQKSPAA